MVEPQVPGDTLAQAVFDGRIKLDDAVQKYRPPTIGESAGSFFETLAQSAHDAMIHGDAAALRMMGKAAQGAMMSQTMPTEDMGIRASNLLNGWADSIEKYGGKVHEQLAPDEHMANAGVVGQASQEVAGGVGSLAGMAALPVPGWPMTSGAIRMGLVSAGQGYYEAEARGASDDQKWESFVGNGLVGGAAGAVPGVAVGKIGALLARADTASGGGLSNMLWEGVKSGFSTGAASMLQQAGSNIVAMHTGDEDRAAMEGVLRAGAGGALTGLLVGALSVPRGTSGEPADLQAKLRGEVQSGTSDATGTPEPGVEASAGAAQPGGEAAPVFEHPYAAREEQPAPERPPGYGVSDEEPARRAAPPAEQLPEASFGREVERPQDLLPAHDEPLRIPERAQSIVEGQVELPEETYTGKAERQARIAQLGEMISSKIEEIGKQSGRARAGLDTDTLKLVAEYAALHVKKAGLVFDDFARTAIEKFGPQVKPYLKKGWAIATEPAKARSAKALPESVDKWIGARDLTQAEAMSRGKRIIADTNALYPKRPAEAKLVREAMLHYIDTKGRVEEELRAHGMPPDEHARKVFERSLRLSEPEKRIAERIISDETRIGLDARKALAKNPAEADAIDGAWRENHIRRYWKEDEKTSGGPAGKFTQNAGTLKARSLSSVLHGFKLGKELAVTDVAQAHAMGSRELGQVVHDRAFLNEAETAGLISKERRDGWERIDHPAFRKFVPPGAGFDYFAPPEVAKAINAVVGSSKLRGGVLDKVGQVQAGIKRVKFLASAFHPFAFQAATTLASPGALRDANPFHAYRQGKRAIVEMKPELQGLVRDGGLKLGGSQDLESFQALEKTAIGALINRIPGVEPVRSKLVAEMDRSQRFIFEELGPALKAHFALLERQRLLKGGATEKQANRTAGALANETFGGLNLARLGRDPTRQHVFHLLALAPDWTESNIRLAARAFIKGDDGAAHRALWGRVAMRGAAALVVGNAMMAAMDDDTFMERYAKAWKADPMKAFDLDITPLYKAAGGSDGGRKYLSILRQFMFVPKMVAGAVKHGLVSPLESKAAPVAQSMLQLATGADWKGAPFTNASELTSGKLAGQSSSYHSKERHLVVKGEQVPSYAIEQAKNALPIQVTNAIELLNGQLDGFDVLFKSLGLEESKLNKKK